MLKKITILTLLAFAATGTTPAAMKPQKASHRVPVGHSRVGWREAFKEAMLNEFLAQNYFPTIDQDADVIHAKHLDNKTPLHYAAKKGNAVVATLLIARGADVNAQDTDSNTPLHFAADRGNTAVATLLITHGADVNARDYRGCTPLHRGAFLYHADNHDEIVIVLLARGADVNARTDDGWTPLHLAVCNCDVIISTQLIAHGAYVNAKTNDGRTPLHQTFFHRDTDIIVALLLAHGAQE